MEGTQGSSRFWLLTLAARWNPRSFLFLVLVFVFKNLGSPSPETPRSGVQVGSRAGDSSVQPDRGPAGLKLKPPAFAGGLEKQGPPGSRVGILSVHTRGLCNGDAQGLVGAGDGVVTGAGAQGRRVCRLPVLRESPRAFKGLWCSVYFNDNVRFNLPSFFHISFCKVN